MSDLDLIEALPADPTIATIEANRANGEVFLRHIISPNDDADRLQRVIDGIYIDEFGGDSEGLVGVFWATQHAEGLRDNEDELAGHAETVTVKELTPGFMDKFTDRDRVVLMGLTDDQNSWINRQKASHLFTEFPHTARYDEETGRLLIDVSGVQPKDS